MRSLLLWRRSRVQLAIPFEQLYINYEHHNADAVVAAGIAFPVDEHVGMHCLHNGTTINIAVRLLHHLRHLFVMQ